VEADIEQAVFEALSYGFAAQALWLHQHFRIYRWAVVRDVRFQSDNFISAVEIVLGAVAQGHRVSEMPLHFFPGSARCAC